MHRSYSASTLSTIGARFWEDYSDARRKAPKSHCIHRVGPAAREDVASSGSTADIGTLDSDVDEPNEAYQKPESRSKRAAGSKALIIYFSKLAKKSSSETIDYRFLDSLFKSGAKVNACDKHGQTALYEVVRNWNVDVARFFLRYGAAMNHKDKLGRTPLHLAAAVNHYDMVEFLIQNGGDLNAKTIGEGQTPIHFAAKYNAVGSLKVIMENKANLNARDYKQRTPIFLAAEMAQEDSARYLIDYGAPVGVFDDTGMSAIGCMVEKMPHVALEALDQFRTNDAAFRKDYFYLNYLDYDPAKWRHETVMTDEFGVALIVDKKEKKRRKKGKKLACPTTALHLAVQNQDVEIIMHSVIQQLIKQKWKIFGQFGAIGSVAIHFVYIMIWTWLAIFLPSGGKYYDEGIGWRVCFEVVGVLLTFYFILKLIWENKIVLKENENYRMWRTRQINRDLEYCHPRWAQEKIFLQSELKSIRSGSGGVLSDPWNILEFLTYIAVLVVIITRLTYVFMQNENTDSIHRKTYTLLLILMWLHFMKSCRPFTTLGPFITMLGHVMVDTGKFTFLFFEFFIPYSVGFWILFGGHIHAQIMEKDGQDSVDWELLNDLLFSVWQVTLNVEHNIDGLFAVNRIMAQKTIFGSGSLFLFGTQIMVGTYFMFATTLCLNLYIALLSETFNQVYQNAKANASLLQANTILQMEKALSKSRLKRVMEYIQVECGPLEMPQEEDEAGVTEKELWEKTIRIVLSKFTKLNDFLRHKFDLVNPKINKVVDQNEMMQQKFREETETFQLYQILLARDKELHQLVLDLYDMKVIVLTYLGERHIIPPKPSYKAIPYVNIKPPQHVPQILINPVNNSQNDNRLFRNIMNKKNVPPPRGFSTPNKQSGKALSASWEDLSSYGDQGTDGTELS